MEQRPKVGVGVMIFKDNCVLLAKRRSSHGAGEYAFPGGHLEFGESIDECARRETLEETGIEINDIMFMFVANVTHYTGKHYLHIGVMAKWLSGEPKNLEPKKSDDWEWISIDTIPDPLFYMCKLSYESYKTGKQFFDSE